MIRHPRECRGPEACRLRALPTAVLLAAALGWGCAGPEAPAGTDATTDDAAVEVVAVVEAVLDAITRADSSALRAAMAPGARVVAVRPGRPPAPSTVDEMASLIADPPQRFVERMWNPQVDVQGPIASVWAPYDFYRGGAFSHCGVDSFQLARVDGAWRVESLVYNTLQPPDCETHPDGPPVG